MNKSIKLLAGFVLIILLFTFGCDLKSDLTKPGFPNTGDASFSTFVTIGNSLTAGYQSGSLYESSQIYTYGNLIADAVGTAYQQPIISDPGSGGRMEILSIDLSAGDIEITTNSGTGTATNTAYPAPYNNLGVPGALLYDVLYATNSQTCASYMFANTPNPMFDLILRNSALNLGTQIEQAAALNPTLVTLWIGCNDVLGFATSGGASPAAPTDVATFTALYTAAGAVLASLGADVVVGNIPNVTTIPFFTTVGPLVSQEVPWSQLAGLGVPGLFYQEHGNSGPSQVFADSETLLTGGVLLTLRGSSYATLIGTPTGKFYKDFGFPALPPGIDTTQVFGLHPLNPWPDALTLDPAEINTALTTTQSYNEVIQNVADANGFGLVDFNTFFNGIRARDFSGGTVINGIAFTTMYILGGIFSLDGVHPTSQGQGIIANEFIQVFNTKFHASIPQIDVSTIPGSLNLTKSVVSGKYGLPIFEPGIFDHLLF